MLYDKYIAKKYEYVSTINILTINVTNDLLYDFMRLLHNLKRTYHNFITRNLQMFVDKLI